MSAEARVAFITGATRGIGAAWAEALLVAGWRVSVCFSKNKDDAERFQREHEKHRASLRVMRADVRDPKQMGNWFTLSCETFGWPSAVIHNAGSAENARLSNTTLENFENTSAVNLTGAFWVARFGARGLLKNRGGHLIFVSSVVSTTGNIGQVAYSAAKAGVVGFARSLARELGAKNIRVNVIFPGFHETALSADLSEKARAAIRARHLLPRTTALSETSTFLLWLLNTETISGQVFNLDSRIPGWL